MTKKKYAILMNEQGIYTLKLEEQVVATDNVWSSTSLYDHEVDSFIEEFERGAIDQINDIESKEIGDE